MRDVSRGKKRSKTGKTEDACRNRSAVSDKTGNFRKKFQICQESIREQNPAKRYNALVTDKTAANFLKEVYRMESNKGILSPGYEGIIWNLDKFGTLTVAGKGKIPDCACGKKPVPPWENAKDQIREIEIGEGITEIGINAFRECIHLKQLSLPDSLQRIHAYAFWNCTELTDIYSGSRNFTYIYDRSGEGKENTVIFGVEAFHNVPWAESMWGDFYCGNGALYVCFSGKKDIVIPGEIRELKPFSMSWTEADSITLPKSLEIIGNFAFSESKIKKSLILPDSVRTIEPYAFANCSAPSVVFPVSWKPGKMDWRGTDVKMIRRRSTPKYHVALVKDRSMGKFRRLKVVEKKRTEQERDAVIEDKHIDVGESLYRRVRGGKVILCITYGDNRICSVKSFAWNSRCGLPEEYLMYPVRLENGKVGTWRDSFTYQEKEDIVSAFEDRDGGELEKEGVLRFYDPDKLEEWFWYGSKEDFGSGLEMELLKLWLKEHPNIAVDSIEENRENDKIRLSADV